jgi:ATP-dependent DNA helicase DinG
VTTPDVLDALARVTAALPVGEERPGQEQMASAIDVAIRTKTHLAVQAGTGTGKTLGYLVPALLSGQKTVVATATKALQDQLASKDLPFLQRHLGLPFDWSILKGRSNYICRQRLVELADSLGQPQQLGLDGVADRAPREEIKALAAWAATSSTGDRADLRDEPSPAAWTAVSVGTRECPGMSRCPSGGVCFAEAARERAVHADVVVVNLHLYGLDLSSAGAILPEHDVVIIDEAHQLEDIVSATSGVELQPGRFADLARRTKGVIADDQLPAGVDDAGRILGDALEGHSDRRLRRLPEDLAGALTVARGRVELVLAAARNVPSDAPEESRTRALRVVQSASALIDDIQAVETATKASVIWVEGAPGHATLRLAPLDVAELLHDTLWAKNTAVLTSATLPAHLPSRLGVEEQHVVELDVGSPFDYATQGLLYCAAHLPDPRSDRYLAEMADELVELITAAGGRTLGLFTSFRVLDEMATRLADRVEVPILTQRQMPKARLLKEFTADEATCLLATMGFWQGVDVPGRALSLVVIDRIPFPRPDEPLLQARRELLGADAFSQIDLPRASTLLAQGAGRLIRSATDTGVVAVLDPRLAKATYRWDVVHALPPMRRTKDPEEARAALRTIRDAS